MSHAFGHRRRSPIELRQMRLSLDWISAGSRRDLGLISARSRPRASLSAHTARGAGRLNSHVIPTLMCREQRKSRPTLFARREVCSFCVPSPALSARNLTC